MKENIVLSEIENRAMAEITDALKVIEKNIPFVTLNEDEKSSLKRVSTKELAFIEKIIDVVNRYPDNFAKTFRAADLKKYYSILNQCTKIEKGLEQLTWKASDMIALTGQEAAKIAREAYKIIQASSLKDELGPEMDDIEKTFAKKTKVAEKI